MNDQLPDADLFTVQGWNPESFYDQMLLFLTDGVLPESMSVDQRRKFVFEKQAIFGDSRRIVQKGY